MVELIALLSLLTEWLGFPNSSPKSVFKKARIKTSLKCIVQTALYSLVISDQDSSCAVISSESFLNHTGIFPI